VEENASRSRAMRCRAAARVPALECLIVVSMWLSFVAVNDNNSPAMKAVNGRPLQ
jgi:hypothetical protein